jgi:hypothetical protein
MSPLLNSNSAADIAYKGALKMKDLSGGCRCGAIRYSCFCEPLAVSYCYCRDCQKTSGGPFCNYAVVPAESVKLTQGMPRSHRVIADSGNEVTREFCGICGAPLFAKNGVVFVLAVGSLDDPKQAKPTIAIWLDSAQPWAPIPNDVARFNGNPPITLGG